MKITFVLPGIGLSGGVKAVFEFANHLYARGHDVSIIYPLIPMREGARWYNLRKLAIQAKYSFINFKKRDYVDWFDLKVSLIRVPILTERYIPDADIVVATWWETAYYVSKYSRDKGEKFYLVQHYETWGGPKKKVDNSYKLGLRIIVNSTWLKNILEDEVGVKVESLIFHSPDREQFYPENNKRTNDRIKILIPYRREKWKGTEDGIKAFKIVKGKISNIQLILFGPQQGENIPVYAKYYLKPSNTELRKIYNSCDIFLFPSRFEGFGMPPMEAMACRLAVATTNVGAVPDYTIPGKTALVSPPQDIKKMAQNVIKLIENKDLREEIAQNGCDYIKQFTWEKATEQLEEVFKKYIKYESS